MFWFIVIVLIAAFLFRTGGTDTGEARCVSDNEYPFSDCDHDCLSCRHLDDDCRGDETFQIDEFLDFEEEFEDNW